MPTESAFSSPTQSDFDVPEGFQCAGRRGARGDLRVVEGRPERENRPGAPRECSPETPSPLTDVLRADPTHLRRVPKDLLSEPIILAAIEGCQANELPAGLIFRLVPKSAVTPAVAKAVAVSSEHSIKRIPPAVLTGEVLLASYLAYGAIPAEVFSCLSEATKRSFGRLKVAATEWTRWEDLSSGLSFSYPSSWSVERRKRGFSFAIGDEGQVVVELFPAGKAPALGFFLERCQGFRGRLVAAFARLKGPDHSGPEDRRVERQGFNGLSRSIRKKARGKERLALAEAVSKRIDDQVVLVFHCRPFDSSLLTREEFDSFLESFEGVGPRKAPALGY